MIGPAAGYCSCCCSVESINIGYVAGRNNFKQYNVIAIGGYALCGNKCGNFNVGIGYNAAKNVGCCTSPAAEYNLAIGPYAQASQCRGAYNFFIGLCACSSSICSCKAFAIGGCSVAPGSNIMAFGYSSTTNVYLCGTLSKAAGTFSIPHPVPSKKQDKELKHSFVESPTAGDNLYRYKINIKNCCHSMRLPSYYKYLNTCNMAWVYPDKHFGNAYAEVDRENNLLNIKAEQDGDYNILLMGTRCDPEAVHYWKGTERDG
tara:strand:- start:275 stop:1054 length:780 start_codon:yes stop_codon:yes gene_type:complete